MIHKITYLFSKNVSLKLESGSSKDIKLPQALEKVLAFKDVRAQEVGVTHEEIEQMNTPMGTVYKQKCLRSVVFSSCIGKKLILD